MVVNRVVLAALIGGLMLWLLLCTIRRKIRIGNANGKETERREKAALFGAMLGFPAGSWIYDKLYLYLKKQG